MCGRYAQTRAADRLANDLRIDRLLGDHPAPSWNVAPTDQVPIVVERRERDQPEDDPSATRQLRTARWGLVPSWAKDLRSGARMINARSETVTVKPAYRASAARRRAIQPASGYYEWQPSSAGPKTPFYLHGAGSELLAFAALYEWWRDPESDDQDPARWVLTSTILTHPASDELGHLHDRTPVIVPADQVDTWLDPSMTARADVDAFLHSLPEPHLVPRQVSTAVNSVRNDGPALIEPAGPIAP